MKKKLVIISAPSGTGKTTIIKHLLDSILRLEFSVSATTRQPRGNETNGKEYYFLSLEDFKKRIDNNEFVEWEEVYKDHLYGTLKSEIERIWANGNHILFDVDVRGGINLKKIFGNRSAALFIMAPSTKELELRLIKRGTDNPEKIRMRVEKAEEEMKLSNQFDFIVINNQLDEAKEEAFAIVSSFLER
jgi:guanylate kinase